MAAKSNKLKGPIELLNEAWDFYRSKFTTFVLLVLFMSVFGLLGAIPGSNAISPQSINISLVIIAMLIQMTVGTWGAAALIYAIKEKKIGLVGVLKLSFGKIIPLLLLEILTALIVIGGIILLVIPGIIFMVWFSFSQFALINENLGIINALRRSHELVRGHWWATFGRLLVIVLFSMLFGIPAAILGFYQAGPVALNLVNTAVSAVVTPIMTIYMFLLYTNLKSLRS